MGLPLIIVATQTFSMLSEVTTDPQSPSMCLNYDWVDFSDAHFSSMAFQSEELWESAHHLGLVTAFLGLN